MQKFFQYIRRQPKGVRDSYAMGFASVFTLLVLMVWVTAKPNNENILGVATEATSTSPFATLIKESKEMFAEAKNSVSETMQNEMVLSAEDLEIAKQNLEFSTSTNSASKAVKSMYTEVQIGTTSASIYVGRDGSNMASTSSTTRQ
jgi:hypothetical protein